MLAYVPPAQTPFLPPTLSATSPMPMSYLAYIYSRFAANDGDGNLVIGLASSAQKKFNAQATY
jgi:hypothetical protein